MLHKLLEYIRQQPRATRDMYAFSGAIVSTFLIGFIWLGYLSLSPQPYLNTASLGMSNSSEMITTEEDQESTPPFSRLWNHIRTLWQEEEVPDIVTEENATSSDIKVEYIRTKSEALTPTSTQPTVQIIPTDNSAEAPTAE